MVHNFSFCATGKGILLSRTHARRFRDLAVTRMTSIRSAGAPLGAVKLREEGGTIVGRPSSPLIPEDLKAMREKERFGGGGATGGGGGRPKR